MSTIAKSYMNRSNKKSFVEYHEVIIMVSRDQIYHKAPWIYRRNIDFWFIKSFKLSRFNKNCFNFTVHTMEVFAREIPTFVLNFRLTQMSEYQQKKKSDERLKILDYSKYPGPWGKVRCAFGNLPKCPNPWESTCFSETVPTACGRGRAVRSEMTTLCGSSGYYSYKHLPKGHRLKQP